MIVCYFAHPVGAPTPEEVDANLLRAVHWYEWLRKVEPEISFCAPWLVALLMKLDDDRNPAHRARGMRDNIAVARRCDGIVACGGIISPGMRLEIDAVIEAGGWLSDLSWLGKAVFAGAFVEQSPHHIDPALGNGTNRGAIASGRRWAER